MNATGILLGFIMWVSISHNPILTWAVTEVVVVVFMGVFTVLFAKTNHQVTRSGLYCGEIMINSSVVYIGLLVIEKLISL